MSKEKDLRQLYELLDKMITSDDPEIKEAFEQLMLVVAIKYDRKKMTGPISSMYDKLIDISMRVDALENIEKYRQSDYYNNKWLFPGNTTGGTVKGYTYTSSGTKTV